MSLPELTQALSLIRKSHHLLLLVANKPSLDAFASMVGLYLALEPSHSQQRVKPGDASLIPNHPSTSSGQANHQSPAVDAVSPSHVPPNLQFLSGSSQVITQPHLQPELIIDMAGPDSIGIVRSQPLVGGLRLHIPLPAGSRLTKDQFETSIRALPYDAAITFEVTDLEELGDVFTNHTDFFYNTPIINIDHRAANEHFGTINLVDVTTNSTAEIVLSLVEALGDTHLTPDIATALYAGVVAATDSFQRPNVNPRAFEAAARLMQARADKEAVIQHIVKTKPLKLLKLLGRMYARLREDHHADLFWSMIRPIDFQESGAAPEDIPTAMRELTNNIAGFSAAFVIYDHADRFDVYLVVGKGLATRRDEIRETLGATKENGALILSLTANSLEEAEAAALEKIRSILP